MLLLLLGFYFQRLVVGLDEWIRFPSIRHKRMIWQGYKIVEEGEHYYSERCV